MAGLVRAAVPQVRKSSFPLYDTVEVGGSGSVSAQTIRLFQNGIGALADGFTSTPKSTAETNISKNGGLPLSQSFLCQSVGVSIWHVPGTSAPSSASVAYQTGADTENLARGGVISYSSGALRQIFGPAIMFPAGFGIVTGQLGNDSTSSTGSTDYYAGSINNSGLAASGARFRLNEPIILTQGQSFAWEVEFPNAVTLMNLSDYYRIQICLWGESYQQVTQ